jgi:hypothetical protein
VRAGVAALALVLAMSPRAARADGAAEELDAGGVPGTAAAPGSRWLADRVAGIWDASAEWQVRADASSTQLSGGTANTSHGDVVLAALSATYTPDDQWSLRLSASWSPRSVTVATVPIDASGAFADAGAMNATANLLATSSSHSASAGVDYDAAGSGAHDLSISLTATATYFSTQQEVTAVSDPSGATLDPHGLRTSCLSGGCSDALAGALWPQWVQLGQFAFAASVTDTYAQTTDLSIDAIAFAYDSDPLAVGYFALATVGRSSLGSAAGVGAMRGMVAPSVTHRWGGLAITASGSYATYAAGQGFDVGASARLQYRLGLGGARKLKVFGKAALAQHTDDTGEASASSSLGAGVQLSW